MMDKKTHFKKIHIVKILIPIAVFLAFGIGVAAKYVANNAESGVAVASAIYFTANYAGTASEEGTDDALANIVGVPYLANGTGTGTGSYSTFYFEVRNHENMLLFNERDVEIPYEIYFWLAEEAKTGQKYTVSYHDGQSPAEIQLSNNRDAAVHIHGTLKGGSALSDQYGITITSKDGEAVPIYVVAKSSYVSLSKVLKGKLQVITQEAEEEFIKSKGFVNTSETVLETLTPDQASKMSELFYYVNTNSASDVMGSRLRIAWDADYIEINRNNAFFVEWMEQAPENNWKPGTTTVDGKEYSYIDVTPVGYSSMKFGFFRKELFSALEESKNLNDLITISLVSA